MKVVKAIRWVENDVLGQVPMASISGQPFVATKDRPTHSPHIGEHNDEILAELGYAKENVKTLRAKGIVGGFKEKAIV